MSSNTAKNNGCSQIDLAGWFSEEYGPILPGPNLRSMSLYVFGVDDGSLQIEDMDIAVFKKGYRLEKGHKVKVKQIRKGIKDPIGTIYRGRGVQDYKQIIENRDIVKELEILFEYIGENIFVSLKAKSDFYFEDDCCYSLYLLYYAELDGPGQNLFFAGAVQPSDFEGIRGLMNLEEVEKVIWIWISSKTKQPFFVWCFDGSSSCYYPEKEQMKCDTKLGICKVERKIRVRITDWVRARYFAVFVEK